MQMNLLVTGGGLAMAVAENMGTLAVNYSVFKNQHTFPFSALIGFNGLLKRTKC